MSYNTIIEQGSFTAIGSAAMGGSAKTFACRIDPEWIQVWNYTKYATATNTYGVEYYWQKGMANDTALAKYYNATPALTTYILTSGGISVVNTSDSPLSAAVTINTSGGGSNATQPVYLTGTTTGLVTGSIVRLYTMTGQKELGGLDFEIDTVTPATSFRVRYAMSDAPGANCTGGAYRIVKYDPIFYPRWRYIANIVRGTTTVITTTVQHGYTVGQVVSFRIPQVNSGTITELNGVYGKITAVSTSTITVDIDSSSYAAFHVPLPVDAPCSWPLVVPAGEDMKTAVAASPAVNILGDAEENQAAINIVLGVGDASCSGPAGVQAGTDVMYWKAGRSFSNN